MECATRNELSLGLRWNMTKGALGTFETLGLDTRVGHMMRYLLRSGLLNFDIISTDF